MSGRGAVTHAFIPGSHRAALRCAALASLTALGVATPAHASLFSGDTLDAVANVVAWIALFAAPIIAITVFWLVHILPEKIAEERHHPQAPAIKTLCLLSLFFGGLLWPLAWLWAYSKPVLYKMAYGVDTVKPEHADDKADAKPAASAAAAPELQSLDEQPDVATQTSTRATAGGRERRPWD